MHGYNGATMAQLPITASLTSLAEQAAAAAEHAYVPYSGFRVGAALECADGTVITGCNVENGSYGATICAERTALVTAVAAGHREFTAIVIHVDGDDGSPCGICRQFMSEFGLDLTVAFRRGGQLVAYSLRDLLPDAFDPDVLP